MINNFWNRVNLDSYSESEGYLGYIDLAGCSPDSLLKMADVLVRTFDQDCFVSSLHVDLHIKEKLVDFGLSRDLYERFIEPLLGEGVLRGADYDSWPEDDSELLKFNVFGSSSRGMITPEDVSRLLYLYLECEHYLLFGHAFFVQEDFACYLSDEGIGCISFDDHGVNRAMSLLDSLSIISGGGIHLSKKLKS